MNQCRLCKNTINTPSILTMQPFPKAAQFYPKLYEFKEDSGIVLEVYQCEYCNLLQLCSEPVSYYKEVITAASFSQDAKNSRLKEFEKFMNKFGLKGKKALEVGCGKGPMLDILQSAGFNAVGLEYNKEFVELGKTCERNIIQGHLYDLEVEEAQKFDAFISLNYIEHQPDVQKFIQSLHNITTDDAVGYITAPNVEYLLKTNTLYEFVADHLVYFTKETMVRAFETNGFEVLECEIINNENDIALTVQKRKVVPIQGEEVVDLLVDDLQYLVDEKVAQNKKVAIWGAGHRTLAL